MSKLQCTSLGKLSLYYFLLGVRVIDRRPYVFPARHRPPANNPNRRHLELLTQNYNHTRPTPQLDEIMRAVTALPGEYLYCYNVSFDNLSPHFEGFLNQNHTIRTRSNLDLSQNRLVDIMPGINRSFLYIASQYAHGEMHMEDSHDESGNVACVPLVYQRPEIPAELWIFVFDSQRLIRVIQQVYRPDDDAQQICHFIHLHKNLFFSLPFLEHHNITYTTFYQYFGDSVFVRIGAFHQVINVSPNLAEAINFGSDIWNLVAPHLSSCRCEGVPYSLISPNPDLDVVLTSSQLPAYPCQEPNCDFTSRTYSRFLEHIRTAHARGRPALPANRMWCLACDKSVAVQRVAEHIATLSHRGQYLHSQKFSRVFQTNFV
ncbi:hypothetical protein QAD02_013725 [Eretmocerus hayati]|uniref:Uncharacterized protein n=1 Tax=Eretmocerus hayati TaxID=131215 RepID=A0ACC2P494_9HYME|nr:hypothetical protein QAD02_013725 [Eretmocerus hayati]